MWAQVLQIHLYNEFRDGSPAEPGRSDESPWRGRASPLRLASSNKSVTSRTQHSSAEHGEHDQHFEQAELFTVLKVLSVVCPG